MPRIVLALSLALAFSGCAKKKPAQSPGNAAAPAAESAADDDMKEKSAPDDKDDAKTMRSSDPCEGGE